MRGAKRSIAHSIAVSRLLALELDRQLAGLQLVQYQLISSAHAASFSLLVLARARGPRERAELVVGLCGRPLGERGAARLRRASRATRPSDGVVELLGRHAAEERPADRGVRAEPAADEDVVRLPLRASSSRAGRALEAEVADPVLRARVRAAVEVQAQRARPPRRSASRRTRAAGRAGTSSRSPRSCSAARRCTRSSGRAAGSGRAGSRPPRAPRRPPRRARSGTFATTKFCRRVSRTSPPTRSASSATAIIWSPEIRPSLTGTPTRRARPASAAARRGGRAAAPSRAAGRSPRARARAAPRRARAGPRGRCRRP